MNKKFIVGNGFIAKNLKKIQKDIQKNQITSFTQLGLIFSILKKRIKKGDKLFFILL